MQTRVQLIDAHDWNGKKLSKRYSSRLLELALKAQGDQFDYVIMPHMTGEEIKRTLENLKYSTTLAYGKTSHKVTRRYLKNDILVDASDIKIPETGEFRNHAKGFKILTKLTRKQKKNALNEIYSNMVNANLEWNERKLKIQLFLSKLSSVVSKKFDRIKYSWFSDLKLHSMQLKVMHMSGKDWAHWSIQNSSKNLPEGYKTDSDFKQTRSTNFGYAHDSSSNINISNLIKPWNNSILKEGLHKLQLSNSLIGNVIYQEEIANNNKWKMNEDSKYSNLSQSLLLSEDSNDSKSNNNSDLEAKELDDYLTKRLEKIEKEKEKKEASKIDENKKSHIHKDSSKEKLVLFDDTEYEYILELEEEEDESESEDQTCVDNIFSRSFMEENARGSDAHTFQRSSMASSSNPFQLISSSQRMSIGSMRNTLTRRSEIKDNGEFMQIEERKEDSYIHPALENSAFSNISGIFGQQTFNKNLLSWKDDSLENDSDELEFKSNYKEFISKEDRKWKHSRIPSAFENGSENDNDALYQKRNANILKDDMQKITQDLERIRDLVMNNPEAKQVFDAIYEESQSKSKDKSN